ncbi:PEP-CTERM sorting domain-containing protein [Azohydromonas australica]|uniref:PEP-CTERM sorting domain-containing protein n=1 Tax=Azohydromonas australica TaxID=364039 RepID=UPI00041B371C|nr:PEP-CTERM sorting domain-containing protein [Azohydromonas australica]
MTYAYDDLINATAANDFYGLVSGNDSKGIDELGLSWGNGWTLVAKDNTDSSDDVSSTWQGISFTVNASAKSPEGFWSLSGSGSSLATGPLQLDMVAVVKSSTVYALYFFDDVLFDGSAVGSWLSPAFNSKGVQQDLSHLSVYLRMGDPYGVPSGTGPDSEGMAMPSGGGMAMPSGGDLAMGAGGSLGPISDPAPNAVPEPGSLALVGVALGAMAAIRRKVMRRSA